MNIKFWLKSSIAVFCILTVQLGLGATWYASPTGTADAACTIDAPGTIQAAVSKLANGTSWEDGDTIVLLPGTYDYSDPSWNGKQCVSIPASKNYFTITSQNNDPESVVLVGPGDRIDISDDLLTTNGPYKAAAFYQKSIGLIQGVTITNFNSGSTAIIAASSTSKMLYVNNCRVLDCTGVAVSAGAIVNNSDFFRIYSTGNSAVVYCDHKATYFTNCLFAANQAKNAVASKFSGNFSRCIFSNNVSTAEGTISITTVTSLSDIDSCVFYGNKALNYAAIGGQTGRVVARNCDFIRNEASNYCGAVHLTDCYDCRFIENSSAGNCGAFNKANAYNCEFISNFAGGDYGAALISSHTFSGCIFSNNWAVGSNGAFEAGNNFAPIITNCVFIDNGAQTGNSGVAYAPGGKFYDCIFTGNSATNGTGGVAYYGGTFERCRFIRNRAQTAGALSGWRHIDCYDCVFIENEAYGDYGAIYRGSSTRCTFIRNRSITGNGSAIGGVNSAADNCVFIGNVSSNYLDNGALRIRNSLLISNISYSATSPITYLTPVNCTLIGNRTDGAGIVRSGAVNCIFNGNYPKDSNGGTLSYCIYETEGTSASKSILTSDPGFNMGRNPKLAWYAPSRRSPARDAGAEQSWATSNTLDIADNPRLNGTIDIGCYEYHNMGVQTILRVK